MNLFIGIILFWFSIFGYIILVKKRSKLPYEFILPLIFTLIGIIMFLAGILNVMIEISIVICFCGILLFGYYILKKEFRLSEVFNINFIIVFFLLLYLTIICSQMHLIHYDNFSHWGLIVKTMFINDALPNFSNQIIEFRDYQPGSACFIYYFGFLTGKTEGSMIIAQNYLTLSYFFSLLVFTNSKKKNTKKNYVLKSLLVVFYLFILFGNVVFYNLLVDTLVAVMSIYSFVILYYFRENLKWAFIYLLPVSIYLFLVKNIGIVLVAFNCLGLIYLGFKNKKVKKSFIYAIILGIITVLFFYIWSKHVSYVYGNLSLNSRHALSSANILNELSNKGMDKIFEFCKIYIKHFIDIANNLPNKYIICINLIIIIMIVIYRQNRKKFITCLVISNLIYLTYYGILGIMYLFSMPWDEAVCLAGFNRYMLTVVFFIMGIVLIYFMDIAVKDKKNTKVSCILGLILILIFLFINFKFLISDYSIFLGEQGYKYTTVYKYDTLLGTDNYMAKDNEYYYIYAPNTSYMDSYFLYHLSAYKLCTTNYKIVSNISQFDDEISDDFNKKVIVFDEKEEIFDYLKDNNYKKVDKIYVKR